MSKSKIIFEGKEIEIPQELVDKIKNEVSGKLIKEQIYEILNEKFNGCEVELINGNIYFKKNEYYLFVQDLKNKNFCIDHYEIWRPVFKNKFGLKREEIQEIIKYWVCDTLDLKGYTIRKEIHNRIIFGM